MINKKVAILHYMCSVLSRRTYVLLMADVTSMPTSGHGNPALGVCKLMCSVLLMIFLRPCN